MSSEEAKSTTQNTELVDINRPPPAAALKTAYERTLLKVSSLDGLNKADEEDFDLEVTDLEIDLSDATVDSQSIDGDARDAREPSSTSTPLDSECLNLSSSQTSNSSCKNWSG